jgi:hypothetical protein
MSNHTARNRNLPPTGYIRIQDAIALISCRMFSQEVPEAVLIAALKNASDPESIQLPLRVEPHPTKNWVDPPCEALIEAIRTDEIALFAMTEKNDRIFAIAQNIAVDVMARTGIPRTSETIALGFMDMLPMTLLQGFEESGLQRSASQTFALILKDDAFDAWLSRCARRNRWPVDKKVPAGAGRPARVPVVRPLIKMIVEAGTWRGGMPFKQLTYLVNAKLKDQEVARGTIESALKQLYAETGDLNYRHRKRKRRTSAKRQNERL